MLFLGACAPSGGGDQTARRGGAATGTVYVEITAVESLPAGAVETWEEFVTLHGLADDAIASRECGGGSCACTDGSCDASCCDARMMLASMDSSSCDCAADPSAACCRSDEPPPEASGCACADGSSHRDCCAAGAPETGGCECGDGSSHVDCCSGTGSSESEGCACGDGSSHPDCCSSGCDCGDGSSHPDCCVAAGQYALVDGGVISLGVVGTLFLVGAIVASPIGEQIGTAVARTVRRNVEFGLFMSAATLLVLQELVAGGATLEQSRLPDEARRRIEAGATGAVDAATEASRGRGYYVRFGASPETASALGEQAARALGSGFPHGVSVAWRLRLSGSDRRHRTSGVEAAHAAFEVQKTGARPDHFTVVLDNPVTDEVAARFNTVFRLDSGP